MSNDPYAFYEAVIGAGAILSGFCGTFLSFRVQREATYYRQPVLDFNEGKAKDVYVGLTHFTSAFLLLLLATFCSTLFGFVLPLLALGGWVLGRPALVIGGMIAALILIAAYFLDELVHYQIVSGRLISDTREWKREWVIVAAGVAFALAAGCASYIKLRGGA